MNMLQTIPSVNQTIWTPTVNDAWVRWCITGRRLGRRGVGVKWVEDVDDGRC